jgi:hypothetical protein
MCEAPVRYSPFNVPAVKDHQGKKKEGISASQWVALREGCHNQFVCSVPDARYENQTFRQSLASISEKSETSQNLIDLKK